MSEKCEEGKCCYHDTGVQLMSYPPKSQQQCCFCGALRTIGPKLVPQEGHGKFAPKVFKW